MVEDKYNAEHQDGLFGKEEVNYDEDQHDWQDMPEFVNEKNDAYQKVIVSFTCKEDVKKFEELMEQRITDKTKSLWFPPKVKNNTISMWVDNES